jgi:hypothetical protein
MRRLRCSGRFFRGAGADGADIAGGADPIDLANTDGDAEVVGDHALEDVTGGVGAF